MVGINAKNKNILHEKFLCPICSLIIQDPIQLTECGHRLCRSCLNTPHGTKIKCPECLTETPSNQVMIDRGFQREIGLLKIECSLCNWTETSNKYQDHCNQAHPNPKCKYCDQQFSSVNNLDEHQVLQCQKKTVNCLLKDFGCDEEVVYCNISDHYSTEQHQNSLQRFRQQRQLQMENKKKSLAQTETDPSRSTTVVAVDLDTVRFQELCETLSILLDDKVILSNDGQQCLNNALIQCQKKFPTLTLDFLRAKVSIQETHSFLDGVKHNPDILNQDLASLKEKINDMQPISYDGTFVWKITNFQEKMMDAQSERQTSIYSPPFYSSPTGYKMRARLYLHGDGNARRTHMSLFFVLMRSEYDAILKFPFSYKVTFCLYDQTPAQQHIINSFRPDIKSNSFQRPRSDMNIASGIPKFFPLAMIQQEGNPYVRDDTMFIKIMVDFGDMPKTLLPYALSLNPGLPTHIQRAMIKQEAERRAQQHPQQTTQAEDETMSEEAVNQ